MFSTSQYFLVTPNFSLTFIDATCGDINFFSGEYRIQSLENTTLRMAFVSSQQKCLHILTYTVLNSFPKELE